MSWLRLWWRTFRSGIFDFVLCTTLGTPHGIQRHCGSFILSTPTGSPWFQAQWLGQFRNSLEDKIPLHPDCTTGWNSTRELRTIPAPFWRLWRHLLPSVARVTTHGLRYRPAFRLKYAWSTGCGGSDRTPGTPLSKSRSTDCKGPWLAGLTSGGTTSGAWRSNTSIPKDNCCGGFTVL